MSFLKDVFKGSGGDIVSGVLGLAGSVIGGNNDNYKYQKEFAQNGIRWRVADAKAAGIHPLYALGTNVPTYTPSGTAGGSLGQSLADLGQGIGGAIEAGLTHKERQARKAYEEESKKEDLTAKKLANDLTRAQIEATRSEINQRNVSSKPMPEVNEQDPYGLNFGGSISNLYSLSRAGNNILYHLNADIADAITENKASHATAAIAQEIDMYTPIGRRIRSAVFKLLTPDEQKALLDGTADLVHVPGFGFRIDYPANYKRGWRSKNGREAGGSIRRY